MGVHRTAIPRRLKEWTDIHMFNIHAGNLASESRVRRPVGFCCDIGAPKSVVGRKELNRILNAIGMHERKIFPSRNRFRFADAVYESSGRVMLPLFTPPGASKVIVEMDIVTADILALLGMDVLDKESLAPCTVSNRLVKRVLHKRPDGKNIYIDEWSVPKKRSASNHLYADLNLSTAMYFTRTQLSRLHRQIFHPSAQKLFNLLKRSRPEEATAETMEVLKDLPRRCDPCQRIQHAPVRFRVTIGAEDVRFNERIFFDIMVLDGDPVLHIVDDGTKFSAARFLPDVSTDTIWKTIVECWSSIYTDLPNRILTDQGSQFGEKFIDLDRLANVEFNRTGIEAHASLGLGERYHEPLRTTFRKIKISRPDVDKDLALACSVKAMNDTLGPEGLVPSALVFGEFPQIGARSEIRSDRSTVKNRAAIADLARKNMSEKMAELKVKRALHHAVPPACDRSYQPGDKVLVWREELVANRIGEWVGPFEIEFVEYDKKLVFIRDVKIGPARPFNVAQVKPYYTPEHLLIPLSLMLVEA